MSTSDCLGWTSVADLVGDHADAPVALIGAPLNERSLTPGRCDLGPKVLRQTLPRFSTYDLETRTDLSAMRVHDAGDVFLKAVSPADASAAPASWSRRSRSAAPRSSHVRADAATSR